MTIWAFWAQFLRESWLFQVCSWLWLSIFLVSLGRAVAKKSIDWKEMGLRLVAYPAVVDILFIAALMKEPRTMGATAWGAVLEGTIQMGMFVWAVLELAPLTPFKDELLRWQRGKPDSLPEPELPTPSHVDEVH